MPADRESVSAVARAWDRGGGGGVSLWDSEDVPELGSGISQHRDYTKIRLTTYSKWLHGKFYVR